MKNSGVTSEMVEALINAYNLSLDRHGSDEELHSIGQELSAKLVNGYIDVAIANDIQPHIVLRALSEAVLDGKNTTEAVVCAIKNIMKWKFRNPEKAEEVASVVRKVAPQVCSTKTCMKLMKKLWSASNKIEEKKEDSFQIVEKLLSLIPPLFNRIYNDNSVVKIEENEKSTREICDEWIEEVFSFKIKSFMTPALIDMLSDLPLTLEQLNKMVDFILQSVTFRELPQVTEKIFDPLRQSKKLTHYCLKSLILSSMHIEKEGMKKDSQLAQCSLIKKLSLVASNSRIVLDSLTVILSSKDELPHHFTPFLVSLSLYLSKMRTKIYDSLMTSFDKQMKDDQMRINSRFLRHIYNLFPEQLSEFSFESIVNESVELTRLSLETNIRFLVEFAFSLVDKAPVAADGPFKRLSSKIKESSSEFVTPTYRQIEIGVRIIDQCVKVFPVQAPQIFQQIVQRLITKMPNSESLIRCLNSNDNPTLAAESLVEVVEQMQYLDLSTLEQVLRIAIPKIIDEISLIDRVVVAARKAFYNRSESSKRNGLAALFYIIQPRSEQTFTQVVKKNEPFGERVSSVANEDLQFEIFGLIQRGFCQDGLVQSDAFMFIPLLLQQNIELSTVAAASFTELLNDSSNNEEYPLLIKKSIPYLLQSISDSLRILPKNIKESEEWSRISKRMVSLATTVSKVEFVLFTEEMKILTRPEERDIVIATYAVLFNFIIFFDRQVALDLFNTYDRILHKASESEKIRKDTVLRSTYNFRFSINVDLILELFKILETDDEDFSKHYGVQLFTLERIKAVVTEIPSLRLEYRIARLQLAMQLGKLTIDAIDKVKWCEAPSGMKSPQTLMEILTENFRKLFIFVFETYDRETVKIFLINANLMTENQTISSAQNNLFRNIKYFFNSSQTKCADNFCRILEKLSLLDIIDPKFFERITKFMKKLIQLNKNHADRMIRLARAYSPAAGLNWLKEASTIIIERLADEEGSTSSSLHEVIQIVTQIASDADWAISNWISKVDSDCKEKSPEISITLSSYLQDIAEISINLMEVDFTRFQVKYYEEMVKFIRDFLKIIDKLMRKTTEFPNSVNDQLTELVRFATSKFGEKVSKFNLRCQNSLEGEKNTRQNDFDAKMAPQLIFLLETILLDATNLIDKKLIDPDIQDTFCKIKGTDVKVKNRPKKKKQEEIEPEPEPEPEPNQDTEENDADNQNTTDDEIHAGQQPNEEEEDATNDSIEE